MNKHFIACVLLTGSLAALPLSGVYAADNSQQQNAVELKESGKITKQEAAQLKARTKTASPSNSYQGIIAPELTKSTNYKFSIALYGASLSPSFYHNSGDVMVTLVQWSTGLFDPDLIWSVVDWRGNAVVPSVRINNTYTSSNYTINFGTVPAGDYQIKVQNTDEMRAEGNYFIYY